MRRRAFVISCRALRQTCIVRTALDRSIKAVKQLVQLTLSFMYHYSANPKYLTDQSDMSRIPRHSSPSRLAVNQYPSPSPSFQTTPICGSKVPRRGTGITGMQPTIGCSSAVLCFRSGSLHSCKSLNGACTHDVSNMDAGSLLPMSWI